MSEMQQLKDQLDRIEEKLDSHLERISKAETSIEWIRGSIRVGVSLLLSAVVGGAGAIYHYVLGK